jgi:hypothetical protein
VSILPLFVVTNTDKFPDLNLPVWHTGCFIHFNAMQMMQAIFFGSGSYGRMQPVHRGGGNSSAFFLLPQFHCFSGCCNDSPVDPVLIHSWKCR